MDLLSGAERRYLEETRREGAFRCAQCGERSAYGLCVGGQFLCEFCADGAAEKLKAQYAVVYAESQEQFSQFLRWWFDSLTQAEQEDILRPVYRQQKECERITGSRKIQTVAEEFCSESGGLRDFIRSRMKEELEELP